VRATLIKRSRTCQVGFLSAFFLRDFSEDFTQQIRPAEVPGEMSSSTRMAAGVDGDGSAVGTPSQWMCSDAEEPRLRRGLDSRAAAGAQPMRTSRERCGRCMGSSRVRGPSPSRRRRPGCHARRSSNASRGQWRCRRWSTCSPGGWRSAKNLLRRHDLSVGGSPDRRAALPVASGPRTPHPRWHTSDRHADRCAPTADTIDATPG
jgi:hypothetical protein